MGGVSYRVYLGVGSFLIIFFQAALLGFICLLPFLMVVVTNIFDSLQDHVTVCEWISSSKTFVNHSGDEKKQY